jgi:hypothetical protein
MQSNSSSIDASRTTSNICKQKFNVLEAVPSGNVIPADAVPGQPPIWFVHQTRPLETIFNDGAGPESPSSLRTYLLLGRTLGSFIYVTETTFV